MNRLVFGRCIASVQQLRPSARLFSNNEYYKVDDKLFGLTEKQKELRQSVFDHLRKDALFRDIKNDENIPGEKLREMFKSLGKLGALGITVEKEYGGSGGGILDCVIIHEELSRVSSQLGLAYGIGQISKSILLIQQHGTQELKRKYLPKLCSGELIGSALVSNFTAVKPSPQTDYYVINTNEYSANTSADVLLICALTDPKNKKISAFIVEKSLDGFIDSEAKGILLRNCKVPVANMLGKENKGSEYCIHKAETVITKAGPVGLMQACCDVAFKCAMENTKFDKYQDEISGMYAKLCATRSYVYTLARSYDDGYNVFKHSTALPLICAENSKQLALNAKKILDKIGSVKDDPIKSLLSDHGIPHLMDAYIELMRNNLSKVISLEYERSQ